MAEQPTQAVATRTPAQELAARISQPDFKAEVELALPEHIPASRFIRAAATALLYNPDIARCDRASVFQSLLRAAQDGLAPDGRQAALVAYKGKAQYLPMIGGYVQIAADHGWSLRATVVHENDEFHYERGLTPRLHHVPVRPGAARGPMIAAYAVARELATGLVEFEVMDSDEIGKARAKAQTQAVWNEWPTQMWAKTVGKRLFKQLPLGERDSERVRRVLAVDDMENGQAADALYGPQRAAAALERAPVPGTHPDIDSSAPVAEQPAAQPAPDEAGAAGEPVAPTGGADPASAPAAPADADKGPEGAAEQSAFAPPAGAVDEKTAAAVEAGKTLVPSGVHAEHKRTLADVAELGSEGEKWILLRLRSGNDDEFQRALLTYVPAFLPEVWERFEAWRIDQEGAA